MAKKKPKKSVCEDCDGLGWRVSARQGSHRTPEGALAVERCDACQFHGERNPRTRDDEDVALLARKAGHRCRLDYPCLLLLPFRILPTRCEGCGHGFRRAGVDLLYVHRSGTRAAETLFCRTFVWGNGLVLEPTDDFDAGLTDAKKASALAAPRGFQCPGCDAPVEAESLADATDFPNGEVAYCPECGFKGDAEADEWHGDRSICLSCVNAGAPLWREADRPGQHPKAYHRGLTRAAWWKVFLAEAERRTGLTVEDFSREDCLTKFYSVEVTPYEAVSADIREHGVTDEDEESADVK